MRCPSAACLTCPASNGSIMPCSTAIRRIHLSDLMLIGALAVPVTVHPDLWYGERVCEEATMIVGVLKETVAGEHRVSLVPSQVSLLQRQKHDVIVEANAGTAAG